MSAAFPVRSWPDRAFPPNRATPVSSYRRLIHDGIVAGDFALRNQRA